MGNLCKRKTLAELEAEEEEEEETTQHDDETKSTNHLTDEDVQAIVDTFNTHSRVPQLYSDLASRVEILIFPSMLNRHSDSLENWSYPEQQEMIQTIVQFFGGDSFYFTPQINFIDSGGKSGFLQHPDNIEWRPDQSPWFVYYLESDVFPSPSVVMKDIKNTIPECLLAHTNPAPFLLVFWVTQHVTDKFLSNPLTGVGVHSIIPIQVRKGGQAYKHNPDIPLERETEDGYSSLTRSTYTRKVQILNPPDAKLVKLLNDVFISKKPPARQLSMAEMLQKQSESKK